MRKYLGMVALILLAPCAVSAQQTRVYTRPTVPSRDVLERAHLKLAWRTSVPIGDGRDGFHSVQFEGDQIFVQTHSGTVVALSAIDGATLWKKPVGIAHRVNHQLGFNSESVFAIRGSMVHALNRRTGQQQWEFDLPTSASAAPAADEQRLYVSVGIGRLQVYEFPKKKGAEPGAAKAPEAAPVPYGTYGADTPRKAWNTAPEPEFAWEYKTTERLEQAPILTDDLMVLASNDGSFLVSSKFERKVPFEFKASGGLAAPLGQYAFNNEEEKHVEELVYIASLDFNLFALDVNRGKILWRFTGAAPIHQKPAVTDEDVYLAAEERGLYRINRASGATIWRNTKAHRFLSANKKFVYAADRAGRVLILDRARGTEHGTLDAQGFNFPIANELTDRFYLASHSGLLVCVYDRDYPKPLVMKTIPPPLKRPAEGKPEEKKPEDKKPEKKPEKEDKEDKEDKKMDAKDKAKDKEKEKEKE